LRALERSKVLAAALGDELIAAFTKLKYGEWTDYSRHLTEWERQHTLDC
jgi:glutamine synthetase